MTHETVSTDDFFFEEDGTGLCGTAEIEVQTERFNDSDLGGTDGTETTVTLVAVIVGALRISRSDMVKAFSETQVSFFEARTAANLIA